MRSINFTRRQSAWGIRTIVIVYSSTYHCTIDHHSNQWWVTSSVFWVAVQFEVTINRVSHPLFRSFPVQPWHKEITVQLRCKDGGCRGLNNSRGSNVTTAGVTRTQKSQDACNWRSTNSENNKFLEQQHCALLPSVEFLLACKLASGLGGHYCGLFHTRVELLGASCICSMTGT